MIRPNCNITHECSPDTLMVRRVSSNADGDTYDSQIPDIEDYPLYEQGGLAPAVVAMLMILAVVGTTVYGMVRYLL